MTDISIIAAEILVAVQLTLGQTPVDPPRVMAVEVEEIRERACGRFKDRCRVEAWYSPEGVIYINQRLDISRGGYAQSVLVHELVHHLQRLRTGRTAQGCSEWQEREREAYNIQGLWLAQNGLPTGNSALRTRFLQCVEKG